MGKYTIELSLDEREELLRVATRGSGPVADARRASVLLAVDKGGFADLRWTDARAAEAYRVSVQTVRNLKRRCCDVFGQDLFSAIHIRTFHQSSCNFSLKHTACPTARRRRFLYVKPLVPMVTAA